MTIENLFAPSLYEKARRPYPEAEPLPAWCYTSPAFFAREIDRIFKRTWNYVGRQEMLPKKGSYQVVDLFGHSIIVVRGKDHRIRAFANSCRHRGTQLLTGQGRCGVISCPYHRWSYSTEGALVAAPRMESQPAFSFHDHALTEVRLENWGGFLFVTLSPDAPDVVSHLGDLPALMSSYELDNMVCVRAFEFDVAANWKLYVEADMENYHLPYVHTQSLGKQVVERRPPSGQKETFYMPCEGTIAVKPDDTGPTFDPIATLAGDAAKGSYFSLIYPSLFLVSTLDTVWWLHKVPRGPARTTVRAGYCFAGSTAARPDFDRIVQRYYARWDQVTQEDNRILEVQQAGLESGLYRPGRFSDLEVVVHAIHNWILDRILDG